MSRILEFPPRDPEEMGEDELQDYLAELRRRLNQLDAQEPEDRESAAYEHWCNRHEKLEDQIDDVLDLLD